MTAATASDYRRCADVPCGCRSCKLGAADPRHGTTNGYGNLYCRCAACCRANTAQMREYFARNRERINAQRRQLWARRRQDRYMHRAIEAVLSLLAMPHVPPDRHQAYQEALKALRQEHECDRCPRG